MSPLDPVHQRRKSRPATTLSGTAVGSVGRTHVTAGKPQPPILPPLLLILVFLLSVGRSDARESPAGVGEPDDVLEAVTRRTSGKYSRKDSGPGDSAMQTAIPPPLLKTIKSVLPRPPAHWVGDGFHVYPVFSNKAFTKDLSPFLMFDYAAPKYFPPTKKKLGVGEHPHRGFETVTIAFEGEVEHRDSGGNCGVIGPGDVQWMTAGSGVLHEEFHSTEFAKNGGSFEMCQLWVNLPAKHKMTKPRYQGLLNDEIPLATLYEMDPTTPEKSSPSPAEDGQVRIIAGSFNGVSGPAKTWTQVDMWDILINNTKKEFVLDTVEGNNVIIFVRKGGLKVQGKDLGPQDVAMTNLGGSKVVVQAKEKGTKVLLLAGEPIDEPISARGPFVMNTPAQIQKAITDFQSGKFGSM